ncbi:MAG: hypothetical protein R2780_07510 [Crocinitomicaceae bacterium]
MKTLVTITSFFFAALSFSQTNLSGAWFAPDSDNDTPLGYNFKTNGELQVFEVKPESDEVYKVIPGNYYYEDGSNLLVTITWYGDQAKTTKYNFSFDNNGKLVLEQTYPVTNRITYEREGNLADL